MKFIYIVLCLACWTFLSACSPSGSANNGVVPMATPEDTGFTSPAKMEVITTQPTLAPVLKAKPITQSVVQNVAAAPQAATTIAAATPHPAKGAKAAALQAYPDLGKADSMFNRAFRDLYEDRLKTSPTYLTTPTWPMELAKETADLLAPALKSQSIPVATPGEVAVNSNKPNWLQERMGKGSALDLPAYDQRRIYPRHYYYYYDANGRFWIDRYGTRHNY